MGTLDENCIYISNRLSRIESEIKQNENKLYKTISTCCHASRICGVHRLDLLYLREKYSSKFEVQI